MKDIQKEEQSARVKKNSSGFKRKLTTAVLILILVLVALVFKGTIFGSKKIDGISLKGYQAVFLSNGQVYFGKISDIDNEFLSLSSVYYLQVSGSLQSGELAGELPESQMSLAKLGNELHGPEDVMYINRDHVLFIENLKPDSLIIESISQTNQ